MQYGSDDDAEAEQPDGIQADGGKCALSCQGIAVHV